MTTAQNADVPVIRITELSKSFNNNRVLRDVSFDIAEQEVVSIIGPSGSGKSTLLRCLNGLEPIDSGRVEIHGQLIAHKLVGDHLVRLPERQICHQRAQIGMVFQHFNLYPHLTALENVTLAARVVHGQSKKASDERARALLAEVGLADKADSHPARLSGGQQQRVAIARALAIEPKILFFDEPTSALDPELVGEVLEVMRRLTHAGMTMIIVTHEMSFARDVSTQVVFMDGGSVVETGPPSQVMVDPQHERTKKFLGRWL
jgi:polar amino acid transport system ATP-binding protein